MYGHSRWSRDSHEVRQSTDPTTVGGGGVAASSGASVASTHQTIALFGAGSKTATHFLRLALDAGYHVRALLIQQSSSDHHHGGMGAVNTEVAATAQALREEFTDQASSLHWVRADSIYEERACQRVLRGADYVVCMMNDAPMSCYVEADAAAAGSKHSKTGTNKASRHRVNSASSTDRKSIARCKDRYKPIASFVQILYPLMKEVPTIQVFLYQVSRKQFDAFPTVSYR
jgi:hypothetical protein